MFSYKKIKSLLSRYNVDLNLGKCVELINSITDNTCNMNDLLFGRVVLSETEIDLLENKIKRLGDGEPFYYVTNKIFFYNRWFYVDKRVLIPRVETEYLTFQFCKYILENTAKEREISVLDIGAGSMCISLSLKKELEKNNIRVNLTAVDISSDAFEVMKINSKEESNITLINEDIFKTNLDKYDVIISNPPYISASYPLDDSVKNYEPLVALIGGETGVEFINKLLPLIRDISHSDTIVGIECGYDQGKKICKNAKEIFNSRSIKLITDQYNVERFIIISE